MKMSTYYHTFYVVCTVIITRKYKPLILSQEFKHELMPTIHHGVSLWLVLMIFMYRSI